MKKFKKSTPVKASSMWIMWETR